MTQAVPGIMPANVLRAVNILSDALSAIHQNTGIFIIGWRPVQNGPRGPAQAIVYSDYERGTLNSIYAPIRSRAPSPEAWSPVEQAFREFDSMEKES